VHTFKPPREKERGTMRNEAIILLFVKKHKFPDALEVNKTETELPGKPILQFRQRSYTMTC
jgi:hypothetical protein